MRAKLVSWCRLNSNHHASKRGRYRTAGVYKPPCCSPVSNVARKSSDDLPESHVWLPVTVNSIVNHAINEAFEGDFTTSQIGACPIIKPESGMVYHWVYHISWYLVWTLSGYKDFSSISSNGGTAFDSSITNYSKPESRWFQIVITWCLMVPRLSPISSVSKCMDMCGSFQVSDAWWCEKKSG